jgi:hypothetical protein
VNGLAAAAAAAAVEVEVEVVENLVKVAEAAKMTEPPVLR